MPKKLFSCLLTVGNWKASTDSIFYWDSFNPSSDTTFTNKLNFRVAKKNIKMLSSKDYVF